MAATPAVAPWITSSMQTLNMAPTNFLFIKLTPFLSCPTSLSQPFKFNVALSTSSSKFHRRSFLVRVSASDVDQAYVGDDQEDIAVDDDSSVNTKLYFGNLPYSFDSAQLAGIIQDYGNPELIEVLYNKETGKSRGFAFVTMTNVEDCNAVIENLDGREFLGRILRVNFSDKPKPRDPLYSETEFKLFVGNLAWSATSESLIEAFQNYGNLVGARVVYDGDTGKPCGYGFVSFAMKEEMEIALQSLNGVELEGRAMRVSLAQGKRY